MKFSEFLFESIENEIEKAADIVAKNSKPWLKKVGLTPVWRASRQKYDDVITKKTIRKNRKPLQTDSDIHKIIDDTFLKEYGWRARSNVIFGQGDDDTRMLYGPNKYAIYPKGKFKYLWSPDINDLTTTIWDIDSETRDKYTGDKNFDIRDLPEIIKKEIQKKIKNSYQNSNIIKAIDNYSKHEIMINAKEYYLIPQKIFPQFQKELSKKIKNKGVK